ncbi:MAG: hypothetical protein KY464_12895 [Gemmatimonadetes bacterium]|nr:hypothetical protein [Gemmatimonadota bacterium]
MQMRHGWAGLVGVLAAFFAAGCNPMRGNPGDSTFKEDTLARMTPLNCTPPAAALRGPVTVELPENNGRAIRFEGNGRNHVLTVWGSRSSARRLVLSEMEGNTSGVNVQITPAPDAATPWGVLTLDARGCDTSRPPRIVKRHDDGTLTVPDGGYDPVSESAFAVLRGNSGYMLSAPD